MKFDISEITFRSLLEREIEIVEPKIDQLKK